MFTAAIQAKIVSAINEASGCYAIIVDGTQDCSGTEQESVCLRYVDNDLVVHEEFVGLYEPPDTTGASISRLILDVLCRLSLSTESLRAQTYDGAANMSGAYKGCQAIISQQQPLALYVHCGAHCANLVAQHAVSACGLIRDAVSYVQDLGVLYSRSLKYRSIFSTVVDNTCTSATIKPMCQTRWLCRVSAIQSVLSQYAAVLSSLDELTNCSSGDVATKASGLLDRFQQGRTMLLLRMALPVFERLEQLNASLQSVRATVSGMCLAVAAQKLELSRLRGNFGELYKDCAEAVSKLGLEDIQLPRQRCPPRRFSGPAQACNWQDPEGFYRPKFFELVESALQQLDERFDTTTEGLSRYLALENMLLTGVVDNAVLDSYPELESSLPVQLTMFKTSYQYGDLSSAVTHLKKMAKEVRSLFPQVEKLIRLLLVVPATSCTAECSFSALRRLKTWLRSTMTQSRLNAIALCHVHQEVLDSLNLTDIASQFAGRSVIRRNIFGGTNF